MYNTYDIISFAVLELNISNYENIEVNMVHNFTRKFADRVPNIISANYLYLYVALQEI